MGHESMAHGAAGTEKLGISGGERVTMYQSKKMNNRAEELYSSLCKLFIKSVMRLKGSPLSVFSKKVMLRSAVTTIP